MRTFIFRLAAFFAFATPVFALTPIEKFAAEQNARNAKIDAALTSIQAHLASLEAKLAALQGVPPPPPPPTGDDATIQAELTDSSLAGMDKRLGPKAPTMVLPTIWMRGKTPMVGVARSFFSTDLGAQSNAPWDYGSTEAQFIGVADDPLVVNPNDLTAHVSDGGPGPNKGVGVWRLRTGEWGDGAVSEFSDVMWNGADNAFPDKISVSGHTASFGMGDKLGHPIAVARAHINRYDGGFVLYDEARGGVGYIGTVGTQTAWSPWAGLTLPAGKMPLSLAVTPQNEFLLVGVYDRATGKGQMGIIALWGGKWDNQSFPFDFSQPNPGLLNSGVIVGMKIIAWVDLPVKYPTNISACATPAAKDRIEGPDGNASYLNIWDLSTQALRDAFAAKNGSWVSPWGRACVISKYESKAVMVDMTALFQAYHDQYLTTDAAYAITRPQNPGEPWYKEYDLANPAAWPYMKTAWTPTMGAVISVPNPTAVLMSDSGNSKVAIGSLDGVIRYFNFDGSPDGTLQVGPNITSINPDKYPPAGGPRGGGQIVTCRGDRSVDIVNKFGGGAIITRKIQDQRMVDPVYAEAGDTHGVEMRYITVVDFGGKQTLNYRTSKLVFTTQGGAVYGTGPTTAADKAAYDAAQAAGDPLPPVHEETECGGVYALPGHPFAVCGSNVN